MANDIQLPGTGQNVNTIEEDGGHSQVVYIKDLTLAFNMLRDAILNQITVDVATGQQRVILGTSTATIGTVNIAANQNLNSINVLTTLNQIGGSNAVSMINDLMYLQWAEAIRNRVS